MKADWEKITIHKKRGKITKVNVKRTLEGNTSNKQYKIITAKSKKHIRQTKIDPKKGPPKIKTKLARKCYNKKYYLSHINKEPFTSSSFFVTIC